MMKTVRLKINQNLEEKAYSLSNYINTVCNTLFEVFLTEVEEEKLQELVKKLQRSKRPQHNYIIKEFLKKELFSEKIKYTEDGKVEKPSEKGSVLKSGRFDDLL